jgi:glucose-6-phosphate 1-epimerase
MSLPTPLPTITLTNPDAESLVYLNGAHLAHWKPTGQNDVLFMSKSSNFAAGKAIRGGVPIIFPWFGAREGNPQSPAHGFARTMPWNVINCDKRWRVRPHAGAGQLQPHPRDLAV